MKGLPSSFHGALCTPSRGRRGARGHPFLLKQQCQHPLKEGEEDGGDQDVKPRGADTFGDPRVQLIGWWPGEEQDAGGPLPPRYVERAGWTQRASGRRARFPPSTDPSERKASWRRRGANGCDGGGCGSGAVTPVRRPEQSQAAKRAVGWSSAPGSCGDGG